MLEVTHVSRSFAGTDGPLPVLTDVSLTLGPGESAAIMGPSGSGKSTLLYALGALDPPTTGTITLNGQNPYTLSEADQAAFRNRHIGFVFQDHALLPQCTVLENVLVPTLVARDRAADACQARAHTLLEQVGLSHRLSHRPSQLSGGERQRVAIARALVQQPTLLLCDEPTGNLDHRNADAVADLLLALHDAQQTVLIVATHSATLAARFSRRCLLRDGRLQTLTTPAP